jgi:hypothetical protein
MKPLVTLLVAVGVYFGILSSAQAQEGAKAIFYSGEGASLMAKRPDGQPQGQPRERTRTRVYLGLKYWIELVGQGGRRAEVTPEHAFQSGDRIKLRLETNRDGYLYLLNMGSTGRYHLLFPNPRLAGGSNLVKARTVYEIPHGAHITFDDNPGEERLLVLLSAHPMADPTLRFDPRTMALPNGEGLRTVSTIHQKGAKDLTLEVDTGGPEPRAYAVAPLASAGEEGLLAVEITLQHR